MMPIRSRRGAMFGVNDVHTLKLLKLHGSLNWVYSGGTDYYGETIYDDAVIMSWAARGGEAQKASEKVSLIVPPTVGKSGFFQNETVRDQWRIAHTSLRRAGRVYCLGYSLPAGDLLLSNLLAASIDAGAAVFPVDIRAQTQQRYAEALGGGVDASFIRPDDPIPHFVEAYNKAEDAPESFPHVVK